MSINKIQVAVNGKTISSKPIERILVRGEKDSNVIVFTLARLWSGIDISSAGLAYQVLGRNGDGKPCIDMLRKGDGTTPDTFTLTWVISSRFTNASGNLDIWIDIMRGGESLNLNWSSSPVRLRVSDGYVITDYEPITQQLLGAIAELVAKAQESEINAANSAEAALVSQNAAKESEDKAKASEIVAKDSQMAAAASEKSAKDSERASFDSERKAKNSADAAKWSEISARSSENAAAESAERAIAASKFTTLYRDPTSGLMSTAQVIFFNLFDLLAIGAITAGEFDDLQMTAGEFDDLQIAAFDFDTKAKNILMGGV